MQKRSKIKTSAVISIIVHLILAGLISSGLPEHTPYKKDIIGIDYIKIEPPVKAPAVKKPEKKAVRKAKKPLPVKEKKIVKRIRKPEKEEFVIKKEPEKVASTKKEIMAKEKSDEADKKVKPALVEEKEPVTKAETVMEKKEEKEEKVTLFKRAKDKIPDVKEDGIAIEEEEGSDLDDAIETVEKKKEDVKIASLIPSIERLEELDRIESKHTRGVGDSIMESIQLDSTDVRYISYLDHVKLAIELAWNYPEAAARRGLQGEGVLTFTIDKEGALKEIRLINTTGSKILDERFLRAVKMASPFPPIPKNLKTNSLKIYATYKYILSIVY